MKFNIKFYSINFACCSFMSIPLIFIFFSISLYTSSRLSDYEYNGPLLGYELTKPLEKILCYLHQAASARLLVLVGPAVATMDPILKLFHRRQNRKKRI